jgi:hypothetical protein
MDNESVKFEKIGGFQGIPKRGTHKIDIAEMSPATGDQLDLKIYPELANLSAEFLFRFVPCPKEKLPPEFIYLFRSQGKRDEARTEFELAVASWNTPREAGQVRPGAIEPPKALSLLKYLPDANVYLLPKRPFHRYEVLASLSIVLQFYSKFNRQNLRRRVIVCRLKPGLSDTNHSVDLRKKKVRR